jgi:hypothetical protein
MSFFFKGLSNGTTLMHIQSGRTFPRFLVAGRGWWILQPCTSCLLSSGCIIYINKEQCAIGCMLHERNETQLKGSSQILLCVEILWYRSHYKVDFGDIMLRYSHKDQLRLLTYRIPLPYRKLPTGLIFNGKLIMPTTSLRNYA